MYEGRWFNSSWYYHREGCKQCGEHIKAIDACKQELHKLGMEKWKRESDERAAKFNAWAKRSQIEAQSGLVPFVKSHRCLKCGRLVSTAKYGQYQTTFTPPVPHGLVDYGGVSAGLTFPLEHLLVTCPCGHHLRTRPKDASA